MSATERLDGGPDHPAIEMLDDHDGRWKRCHPAVLELRGRRLLVAVSPRHEVERWLDRPEPVLSVNTVAAWWPTCRVTREAVVTITGLQAARLYGEQVLSLGSSTLRLAADGEGWLREVGCPALGSTAPRGE